MERFSYIVTQDDVNRKVVNTSLHGKLYRVVIDDDIVAGDEIMIAIPIDYVMGIPRSVYLRNNRPQQPEPAVRVSGIYLWASFILNVILLALQITVVSVPLAELNIGGNCLINYENNNFISSLYFNVFSGLGTNEMCSDDSDGICINWKENGQAWTALDELTNSNMSQEARNNWPAAAGLLISALAFILLGTLLNLWALCTPDINGHEEDNKLALSVTQGFLFWLVWILNISALNTLTYTDTLNPQKWLIYLTTGVPLESIIAGETTPLNPQAGCTSNITLNSGGSILSALVGFGFFVALFTLVSCCCGLCMEAAIVRPPYPEVVVLTHANMIINEEEKQDMKVVRANPIDYSLTNNGAVA